MQFIPRDEINSLKGATTQFFLTIGYENAFHSEILFDIIFRQNVRICIAFIWFHWKKNPWKRVISQKKLQHWFFSLGTALENSSHGKNFSMHQCDLTKFFQHWFFSLGTALKNSAHGKNFAMQLIWNSISPNFWSNFLLSESYSITVWNDYFNKVAKWSCNSSYIPLNAY